MSEQLVAKIRDKIKPYKYINQTNEKIEKCHKYQESLLVFISAFNSKR